VGPIEKLFLIAGVILIPGIVWSVTLPNDPYYDRQTPLFTNMSEAWEMGTNASTVVVAVIDTGVELDHPDLVDNLWINVGEIPGNEIDDDGNGYVDDVYGYDFWTDPSNLSANLTNLSDSHRPNDRWGHGTLVAGILGARGDNKIGTAGVVWKVSLMILKAFGPSGSRGTVDGFVAAIDYAIENGARIINASWTIHPTTTDGEVEPLKQAIERAQKAGVLVVAAAGNEGVDLDRTPVFPAAYSFDNLISVTAVGENNQGEDSFLEESNFGLKTVSLASPGEALLGPYLQHSYAMLTGTSAATAVVSGVAALMIAERPDLQPREVKEILIATSRAIPSLKGIVSSQGEIDPTAALKEAANQGNGLLSTAGTGEEGPSSSPEGKISPISSLAAGCNLTP